MGHKRLATTSTCRLGESGLAGSEVTARCASIATGGKASTASVAKPRLAAKRLAITAGRKTTVTTTVVTASKAAATAAFTTGGRSATVVTTSKAAAKTTAEATTVIAATCGTTEAAARLVVTVVIRTARGATATTTEIATARCLRRALRGLHARNHFGLELLAAVRLNVVDFAAIAELGKRDGQAIAARTAGTANAVV